MLLILIGGTCSGKSSVADYLVKHFGYKKVIQDTTRPVRSGEANGVDYNFITDEQFAIDVRRDKYIEWNQFREWRYGTKKDEVRYAATQSGWSVLVANAPAAREIVRQLCDYDQYVRVVYLAAPQKIRAIRMLQRGDDLQEVFRRINFDDGEYNGVEAEFECFENGENVTIADTARIIHESEHRIW